MIKLENRHGTVLSVAIIQKHQGLKTAHIYNSSVYCASLLCCLRKVECGVWGTESQVKVWLKERFLATLISCGQLAPWLTEGPFSFLPRDQVCKKMEDYQHNRFCSNL